jgi:hypothetical protein
VFVLQDAKEQLQGQARADHSDHAVCTEGRPRLQHADDDDDVREHVRRAEAGADPQPELQPERCACQSPLCDCLDHRSEPSMLLRHHSKRRVFD